MSCTSPAGKSFQPLAQFASRVGSCSLTNFAIRTVSNCPQPSLKGTHITMQGELRCVSMRAFSSRSKFSTVAAGRVPSPRPALVIFAERDLAQPEIALHQIRPPFFRFRISRQLGKRDLQVVQLRRIARPDERSGILPERYNDRFANFSGRRHLSDGLPVP